MLLGIEFIDDCLFGLLTGKTLAVLVHDLPFLPFGLGFQGVGPRHENVLATFMPLFLVLRVDILHLPLVLVLNFLLEQFLPLHKASELLQHLVDFGVLLLRHKSKFSSVVIVDFAFDTFGLGDFVPHVCPVVILVHHHDVAHLNIELLALLGILQVAQFLIVRVPDR